MNTRLLFAILGFILTVLPGRSAAEKVESLPQIEVVKNWGDLLAQKPVTLQPIPKAETNPGAAAKPAKPLTFRLGIDRAESKQRSGVLLYCLAQGEVAQIDQQTGLNNPAVGPFLIDVQRPADQLLAAVAAAVMDRFMTSSPNALFMMPVPLDETGTYIITLQQALGGKHVRDVASVKVLVSDDLELSWSPWAEPKGGRQVVEATNDVGMMDVANPARGIALPKGDGLEPIFFNELPQENTPLPVWIAAEPDPQIQLKKKGNDLIVKIDEPISIHFPDEHFLTRWWVNDQPFTPNSEPEIPFARSLGAREIGVKEVHFRMDFHPEYLNVKNGDTVGVQLLFCPHGWDGTGPVQVAQMDPLAPAAQEAQADKDLASRPIARMSNRINFVYSGNPEKPVIEK